MRGALKGRGLGRVASLLMAAFWWLRFGGCDLKGRGFQPAPISVQERGGFSR